MNHKHCDICFEDKLQDDFGFLPCTHSFCIVCIRSFRKQICALCRHPFNEYHQNGYSSSLPNTSTIQTQFENRSSSEIILNTRDDLFISNMVIVNRRTDNRLRNRIRRRRRRMNTTRRPRRSENIEEEIFQIDDILPAENETNTEISNSENTEISKNKRDKKEKRNNKETREQQRDNWQYLCQQRSRYV